MLFNVHILLIVKCLMEAFRTDCQTLITRFELSYNIHFQNFCEIWKEMQFGLVFLYVPCYFTQKSISSLNVNKLFLNASF